MSHWTDDFEWVTYEINGCTYTNFLPKKGHEKGALKTTYRFTDEELEHIGQAATGDKTVGIPYPVVRAK